MEAHAHLIKTPAILNHIQELISSNMNERTISHTVIKEAISAVESFSNGLGEVGYGYESHGHKANTTSPEGKIVLLGQNLRQAESERKNIKTKIQIAYQSLVSKKLAKGNTPIYQKFSLLVDVRNELVHPKASVLSISSESIKPPKKEQKMIRKLRSNGFSYEGENAYDWNNAVSNKAFAVWAYQVAVDIMAFILNFWPHKHAIDSFHQMYGLKAWEN